ncbi:pol polyprotein, partial [Tanacetum coccineum]
MFFYLTTLNLTQFLNETAPQVEPPAKGQPSNAQAVQAVEAWKHSDFLCHNYVQDLQVLLHDIHAEGMTHKRKEMSVEDLIVHLHIKEDNKLAQKNTYALDSAKANMVEYAGISSKSNSKAKGKEKRRMTRRANIVNDNVDMIAMMSDVIAMISEVNMVGSNNNGWWVDTVENRHVCADKSMFHFFRAVDNGEKLYMGNSAIDDIKGEGDVILKMTSEKELKLTNVLYVMEIRKNLMSGWLLKKFGFRLVFESDKFVLSKNQMYVGKGYAVNGMFKLNVMVVMNDINKMSSSAYLIESSNVWHGRLGHRQDQLEEEEVEPRRSKRARTEKSFGPDFVSFMVENEPTSYREAVTSSEGHQWKEAIKSEIDSILQNHTWELVDLPPGCKPLGYKWIFKKKMKADGTIDKYKARLVIKGYRQREGLDYFDTYSPVTRITSIRMVLAIAALRNLEVHQMDVKTAFLN